MKLTHRYATHRCECVCCGNHNDKIEFQKIVQSNDIGLAIYRYTPQTQDEKDTTGDVFVLRNTKSTKVTTDDLTEIFEQNVVTCPKCFKIIAKAENFLKNISAIDREDVTGICDHCVRKRRPLSSVCKCKDIVDKFLVKEEEERRKVKTWLEEVRLQLKKTSPDRHRNRLKILSQSEISLNTAVSKFSKTDYKHSAEIQPGSQPYGTRTTSSLDSLHDVERLPPKEFEHLFTPMKYLKQTYSRRKVKETKLPESIFTDAREYIDRVMSPETTSKSPIAPQYIKGADEITAGKKLQSFGSHVDISKGPEQKRGIILKSVEDEKIMHRQPSILREPPETARRRSSDDDISEGKKLQSFGSHVDISKEPVQKRGTILKSVEDEKTKHRQPSLLHEPPGRRRSSVPTPPWKQDSDESFKTLSEKLPKVFSFSFPHEKQKKVIGKRQASSSELIKNTQDMLQAKAEEEKRKKEEEIKKKREEQEQKKLEREKKREEVLAAKAAKAAFEEKRRHEEKLDKEKIEQERRKGLEEKVVSLESVIEKLEENKNTPNTSVSSKQKSDDGKHAKPYDKKEIHKEISGVEKKSRKTKEDKTDLKETFKKDKEVRAEGKGTKNKDDLDSDINKTKQATKQTTEAKKEEKHGKSDKENKQKMDKEKQYESDQPKESKQKKDSFIGEKKQEGEKSEKKYESDQPKETIRKLDKEKKIESDQPKESKQKKESTIGENKHGEKSEKKEAKPKTTEEQKSQVNEPKGKVDNKLENDTLKALLASQQKEKQEQEKRLKEQRKEEELARKKALEAAKSGKLEDKMMKEDAATKLKKMKEMAAITDRPSSPKKEDAPTSKELALKQVKVMRTSVDDVMLNLIRLQQDEKDKPKLCNVNPVLIRQHGQAHKKHKRGGCPICSNSDLALQFEEFEMEQNIANLEKVKDVIIGEKIFKFKGPFKMSVDDLAAFQGDNHNLEELEKPKLKEDEQVSQPTRTTKTKADGVEPEPAKGIIRYALSDRTFIEKGWTMLPTEKVVRKMNVYRMRPAHPEFDWFEHNKYKRIMQYDCGAKLAEFDDNGRGRWYYRSGKLALDYYDAEELNAQQRFVVYSSGEPDERGRTRPRTILAAFDYLGNGVVFDHTGKIRLKYNQTEGVVLDRSIGPVSHWKWHTLNDPPVLQQVMIDTQMSFKDPRIMKLAEKSQDKEKLDNEEMLAIEFDNFIKEKSRKLSQKFKPFQIKMKALKINEYFSLRVLDQATVYLLFRDGTTNLKINMGMILDHKEIVDTDTAEVGEVSNSLERLPARTDSIAALQQAVAQAQRTERSRVRHERRLKPPEPCASADQLRAGASRPLRPPLMVASSASSTRIQCHPHCPNRFKKPSSTNLYYDTRL